MPDLLKAALLGMVQGLTEFLPVSSTGHLVLLEDWLGVSQDRFGLTFDAAIHLGTLAAILVYFWPLVAALAVAWARSVRSLRWDARSDSRLAWLIVIGSAPAAVLGFLFEDVVEDELREPVIVAVTLILFSGVLLLAERLGEKQRDATRLGVAGALFVGFAQAVALIPGVSRSGITISAGLFAKLKRQQAALFAFLLSAPIIAGAGLKQLFDVVDELRGGLLDGEDLAFFLTGLALAAVTGYLTIRFLLAFLREHSLYPFVAYRVTLGVVILLATPLT